MLRRTHLALGAGIMLYFLPHVNNRLIFAVVLLISSLLPELESFLPQPRTNKSGKRIRFLFSKRGILHTYTFCILISILFAFFYPVAALPFFLGYSFHLLLDAFTTEGIVPFWPIKTRSEGKIKTGGKIDKTIFFILLLVDIALAIKLFL